MPIHIPTIETAIKTQVPCTSQELETILEEVRSAITQHLLQFSLVPQGIFQIRLVTEKERKTSISPHEQTYLVVSFGEKFPDEECKVCLSAYYGKVLFLHFQLHHSLCL